MFIDKIPAAKNTDIISRIAAFVASLLILFILLLIIPVLLDLALIFGSGIIPKEVTDNVGIPVQSGG